MPYYPEEYALRELIQFYSFTGLQILQNSSETEQNQHTDKNKNQKTIQQQKTNTQLSYKSETKTSQKERKK